jgi:hypothetical protein
MTLQEQRTQRALSGHWYITPIPLDRLRRLPNRKIKGAWRVRNHKNGHRYLVHRFSDGWGCDCPDFVFNRGELRCKHIEAIRLWKEDKIEMPVSTRGTNGKQTNQRQGDERMTAGWKDRKYKRSDDFITFPFIQWVNNGGSLEPRADRGGFACPTDQGLSIPGTLAKLHHRDGGTTEVIFATQLEVAIVQTRFAWIMDGMRRPDYVDGARGKLQAVCYVKGPKGNTVGPVMLTFTGLTTKRFNAAHRSFMVDVQRVTQGQAPSYAFWMKVQGGKPEMVGGGEEQSLITPIELGRKVDPNRDYVGEGLLDGIPWEHIDKWAAVWEKSGPNGEGSFEDDEGEIDGSHAPSPPEPDEGSLEWAKKFPLPFEASSYSKGDLLGSLDEEALKWIKARPKKYPGAAKAAKVLLDKLYKS